MRKILIAVVAVGICFGVTDVEAKPKYKLQSYSCPEIWQKADGELSEHYGFQRLRKKLGIPQTREELVKLQAYSVDQESALNQASQWATIYTAFCK